VTSPWHQGSEDMVARQLASDAFAMAQDAASAVQSATSSAGSRLTACRLGSGKTGLALLVGGTSDVAITWKSPMPYATYTVEAVEGPGILGAATLTVKSQTQTGCVITVTAQLAIAAGATVLAHAYC
jgi:hypothetical protein